MGVTDTIREKLCAALTPDTIVVEDQSESHRGHAGYREGGETHFRIEIVAVGFVGLSRIQRHRRVYEILNDELNAGVHALELTTLTPDEEKDRGGPNKP